MRARASAPADPVAVGGRLQLARNAAPGQRRSQRAGAQGTADYPGVRKAAILCVALGDQVASEIFKFLDEDEVQPIRLRKGTNVLVFKVVNQAGPGPFGSLHFVTKNGGAAPEGIEYRLAP